MRASREALDSLRSITRRVRPRMLDCLSLEDTFRDTLRTWQRRFSDISYEFQADGRIEALPEDIRVALYRILQESLTNVAKHAKATKVDVRLSVTADQASLIIADNGVGLREQDITPGIGLLGMKERSAALRGEFAISDGAGEGTRLCVRLPLE
jgi:two-component system sensor histidine kinase UhpB